MMKELRDNNKFDLQKCFTEHALESIRHYAELHYLLRETEELISILLKSIETTKKKEEEI